MKRVLAVVSACAVVVLCRAAPVLAHGEREQAGLVFTVGWANEPALVGEPNAVQLVVERGGRPVQGAERTLKVTVSIGEESTDLLELRPVFDAPGEYRADLIPTVVGGYTFRFTGTIGDERVDETFTSLKDGFDEVAGTTDTAFPKQAPTTTELAAKLASVERDAADAKDAVALARIIAIAGVVVGFAGIALALSRRRA